MPNILVVDDDPLAQEYFRRVGSTAGYDSLLASNGLEALEILKTHDVEFIITDVSMPEMDGIEFAKRARTEHPETPVAFMSLRLARYMDDIDGLSTNVPLAIAKPASVESIKNLFSRLEHLKRHRKTRKGIPDLFKTITLVPADVNLDEGVHVMYKKNQGALALTENNKIIGLFSNFGILEHCVKQNAPAAPRPLKDFAELNFTERDSIPPETDLAGLIEKGIDYAVVRTEGVDSEAGLVSLRLLQEYYRLLGEERSSIAGLSLEAVRDLMATTQDLIAVFGQDFRMEYASPSWERSLGYPKEYLASASWDELVHPDDLAKTTSQLENIRKDGFLLFFRNRIKTSDDDFVSISWNASFTHDHYYLIGRDITAKTELSSELEESKLGSHTHFRLAGLGQISASITHEINNPLTVLQARVANARRLNASDEDRAKIDAQLQGMEEDIERIADIIELFREISRGEVSENFAPFDLATLIDRTIQLCNSRIINTRCKICVHTEPVQVFGRRASICQVFTNLINNACDALHDAADRTITLRTEVEADTVSIRVINAGTIPDKIASEVFKPFFSTKPVESGTGLGLSICRQIVETHNGKIELEQANGEVKFCVQLPIYRSNGEV